MEDEIQEEITVIDPFAHELEWECYEYEHYEKSPDWYWAFGVVALGLLVVAFIFKNFLFGAIILIGAFAILIYASRRPAIITVTLTSRGVKVNSRLYPYQSIKSFWVEYDPPFRKELILESDRLAIPLITLHLHDTDPLIVREYLRHFLREKHHEESFATTISRLLKF